MQHRVHAGRGMADGIGIGQIAADLAHAHRPQRRIFAALEADHVVAAFDQPAAQGLAEESAAARDQDLHCLLP